jgi:hypothetical protein
MRRPSPLVVAVTVAVASVVAAAVQIDHDPVRLGALEAAQQALPLPLDGTRALQGSPLTHASQPILGRHQTSASHAAKGAYQIEAAPCACQAALASAL